MADPVVLFRAWRPSPAGNLVACYRRTVWPRGEDLRAVCSPLAWDGDGKPVELVSSGHAPPDPTCECGVWGCYAQVDLRMRFRRAPQWAYVYGAALGFGTVSHGERGLRAAQARVLCIADDSNEGDPDLMESAERYKRLTQIATRYSVALIPWSRLTVHAARFGDVLPKPQPELVTGGTPDVR